MKIPAKHMLVPLIVIFTLALWGAAPAYDDVYRVQDGKAISFREMIEEIKKADIVFVGEVHTNTEHHEDELEIIRALHEADVPIAIGLEMFRADSQKALGAWVKGETTLEQFVPMYYDNWRVPWPLYRDIFLYAQEHTIPLVGLNIPDEIASKVARYGFASLTAEQMKQLPPNIGCDVDATYMDFIRKAYADHARAEKSFLHFCEAQMVWDKSMAWHLIAYLKANPGKKIVVLSGVGHAWKRGIPEQVQRLGKFAFKAVLPLIPDQIEKGRVSINDADYILLN